MTNIRAATHSGSWYSDDKQELTSQLRTWLNQASSERDIAKDKAVPGARVVIGPHAGYYYSGKTLADAYSCLDLTGIKTIFILGPSHHVYFRDCALTTGCGSYETPLGGMQVDTAVISKLVAEDNLVRVMSLDVDEEEHSFEMHMPFLRYIASASRAEPLPKIVPLMISGTTSKFEKKLAAKLRPYFEDKSNAFCISTDFCHWGSRFGYMAYTPTGLMEDLVSSARDTSGLPIYRSIEAMDRAGMDFVTSGSYADFRKYIEETGNTICGAKPLLVLLALMAGSATVEWTGYAQSSHVKSNRDSSVSYAAGYAVV